jgi:beta-phosphoglucomutase-like phosphatase (HAD superfamily)
MPDAVLCELEGVLVDATRLRDAALRAGLAAVGAGDAAAPASAGGRGTAEAVRDALAAASGGSIDETLADLATLSAESHFAAHAAGGLSLIDGAREFVESAAGRVRLAVVTRARRREAETMLALAGLADGFEFVVAAEDAAPPKPHPAPYERALARLARRRPVARERVVALESGAAGVAAARAAGLFCVAVGSDAEACAADAWLASLRGETPRSLGARLARAGGVGV